jgi:hypothetical protein
MLVVSQLYYSGKTKIAINRYTSPHRQSRGKNLIKKILDWNAFLPFRCDYLNYLNDNIAVLAMRVQRR